MSETLRLRPGQFQAGDRLANGKTVAGVTFVRGGVRVDYREGGHAVWNGRYKYDVKREAGR